MIRPVNDFRIGNLVLDEDGELCKIEQLSSEKMECFQQVSNIENKFCISSKYPSNIYAIELTEEWFLKAGFENCSTYEFSKDNFHITGDIRAFYFSLPFMNGVTLNYVHELQNLYFCLCGEELVFSTEP